MTIPKYFCWTRFGTEAAQPIELIVARKEEERRAGNGIFLWGIGNAVGDAITRLVASSENPKVLFSPIRSRPRACDVNPPAVAAWSEAVGLGGENFSLPERALVTSRFDPLAPRSVHYALVCQSEKPLAHSSCASRILLAGLKNLVTGRPVGFSQVTAVVEYEQSTSIGSVEYEIAFEARLVPPYFVRLYHPVLIHKGEIEVNLDFDRARSAIRDRRLERARKAQLALSFP